MAASWSTSMPFRSEAQRRKLWATNPEVARKWEAITPSGSLPERVTAKAKPKHHVTHHPAAKTPVKRHGVGRTLGR